MGRSENASYTMKFSRSGISNHFCFFLLLLSLFVTLRILDLMGWVSNHTYIDMFAVLLMDQVLDFLLTFWTTLKSTTAQSTATL